MNRQDAKKKNKERGMMNDEQTSPSCRADLSNWLFIVHHSSFILSLVFVLGLCGCTTTAAKKALNKPAEADAYAGFNPEAGAASKRKAEKPAPVKEDTEPEEAVNTLVAQLQREPAYAVPAEEQLKLWGLKQGVGKIVVGKVRLLLKHPKVEVRAPALRLTILFGRPDSNGDLIEALADSEYGIRSTAFRSLQLRTHRDFSFDPAGGEVARLQAVDAWRRWWQDEQRRKTAQEPTIYEEKRPEEPKVITPK